MAARSLGWRTAWTVEIDPHCQHWLREHFPEATHYGDITQIDFRTVEPVDILCGGFPCQPVSAAGKRAGTADDRWLWPEYARAIRALRPRWVVAENVPGLFSANGGRAFAEVLRDLAALGYDARWDCLSAAECGAPHKRERVWIVAYPAKRRQQEHAERNRSATSPSSDRRSRGRNIDGRDDELGDARGERRERNGQARNGRLGSPNDDGRMGDANGGRWGENRECRELRPTCNLERSVVSWQADAGKRDEVPGWDDAVAVRGADGSARYIPANAAAHGIESSVRPLAHGVPGRMARLRAAGNAIVPRWAVEGPFRFILDMIAQEPAA